MNFEIVIDGESLMDSPARAQVTVKARAMSRRSQEPVIVRRTNGREWLEFRRGHLVKYNYSARR